MKYSKSLYSLVSFSVISSLCLPSTAEPPKTDYSKLGKKNDYIDPKLKSALWDTPSAKLSGPQIRDLAAKATVVIFNGKAIATGFFVDKGLMVTNQHVIASGLDPANKLEYYGKKGKMTLYKMTRILASDSQYDLAVVEVHPLSMTGEAAPELAELPCLKLANQFEESKSGQKVFAYGNPRAYEGSFVEGIISAFRDYKDLGLRFSSAEHPDASLPIQNHESNSKQMIQLSMPIDHGSSGSALLNERAEVIGVCAWGDPAKEARMSVNFAAPVSCLRVLINKARAKRSGLSG